MADFTYKCEKCKKIKTVEHKMLERPQQTCGCGNKMTKIISSGIGVSFNGAGFYKTGG